MPEHPPAGLGGFGRVAEDIEAERLSDQEAMAMTFEKLERKETADLVKGLTTGEIGDFLYNIPHKTGNDDPKGVVACGVPDCKYAKNKMKHVHVCQISSQGVDEVARIYEGIQVVDETHVRETRTVTRYDKKEEKEFIIAKATARDIFTGAQRTGISEHECTDKFDISIAYRKAARNAIKRLLPQALINELQKQGIKGETTFTQEMAERLIDSIGGSRKHRIARFFVQGAERAIAVAEAPRALPPPQKPPATGEAAESSNGAPSPPPAASPTLTTPRSVILEFGKKHRGESLGEIFDKDRGYIEYLARDCKDPKIKAATNMLLGEGPKEQPKEEAKEEAKQEPMTRKQRMRQRVLYLATQLGRSADDMDIYAQTHFHALVLADCTESELEHIGKELKTEVEEMEAQRKEEPDGGSSPDEAGEGGG